MADEGLRLEAWSMPHVGSLTRKFDFTKWIESYTLNDRFSDLCDGVCVLADDLPATLKNKLFKIDEANHANDAGSMVRVLRGTTPIMHYMVTRSEEQWSDDTPRQKLTLEGMEWLLDKATVPHQDHPREPFVEPDWIYGADTLLVNAGLESSGITSAAFQLTIAETVTSGTFTITIGAGTTAAINWNVDAVNLALAIEALAAINDVLVSGVGTEDNPFIIEFLDPDETDVGTISVNSGGLTGGLASPFVLSVGGSSITDPWTRSRVPITGLYHGTYNQFRTSTTQAHTGTTSLYINADLGDWPSSYPGAQQVVSVTPGRTYRAEIWVYPEFAARYRFGIRTVDETWLATTEADLTADSFQQLTLSVTIPDHISQIVFRIACIANSHGVQEFYVDTAVLAPGFPAATLGEIMGDVLAAAVAQGVLIWITPTWTDSLDSDGAAWDRDLKWNVAHNQTFLQLLEYIRRWNYEWRIRWDDGDNRFEWDMWNPSGGGQTRTGIAITGKSGVTTAAPIVKRPPVSTYMRVEGERGHWGDHASTTLDDIWGRLEQAQADRQGVAADELDVLAQRLVERGQDKTAARSVTVEDPYTLPWSAYEPGDTVMLNMAPTDTRRALRVSAVVVSMSSSQAAPRYDVHFVSPVLSNEAAIAQGVRDLIRELRTPKTTSVFDGRPVTAAALTDGRVNSFSLPGQAFVEVGRLRLSFGAMRVSILGVMVNCNVAPTGSSIIVDLHRSGTTIFTAQDQRPTIAVSAFTSGEMVPAINIIEPGEYVTVDVDQVGLTLPGGGFSGGTSLGRDRDLCMTALLFDGFDHGDLGDVWTSTNQHTITSPVRTGTHSLHMSDGGKTDLALSSSQEDDVIYTGFGFFSNTGQDVIVLQYAENFGAVGHVSLIRRGAIRGWEIRKGTGVGTGSDPTSGTQLVADLPNVWFPNSWHYVEFGAKIHDSLGWVEMRQDGVTLMRYDGDTRNGGTDGLIDRIAFGQNSNNNYRLDDVYILNEQGSINNSWLGDTRCYPLYPNGNGTSSTPLSGSDGNSTDNYLLVDEVGAPVTTDYVFSQTPGDQDTYTFEDLPVTLGTIRGVEVRMHAAKEETGTKQIRAITRRSATDSFGPDHVLAAIPVYQTHHDLNELDPHAGPGAWTITNVNGTEWGVEVRA